MSQILDFPQIPVFAGLDYHQDSVQVCVLDQDGKKLLNRSVANSTPLIFSTLTQFGTPLRIGVEACCGAANLADELVTQYNLPVQLAHPGYVNRMKRSPDKTDFGDAQMLADLSRVNYLPKVWLAPSYLRELRRLVRHRGQLVKRRTETKLRIRGLLRENRVKCPEPVTAWSKPWLAWLQQGASLSPSDKWVLKDHLIELNSLTERIGATEAQIAEQTKDDPVIVELLKLKGVGLITAVTLRAEIGRVDRFLTGKQLARFCGVTPRNASSGARQADAGLIRAGNPDLRCLLIELAHRLIRYDESWQKLAYSLISQGKHRNVAVAAVANRWVRKLFHLWRADFTPNMDFLRDGRVDRISSKSEPSPKKKSLKKTPQARRDSPALT
ncbi:IS110 family transposase [Pirellulaceae bacterium SH449]